jgi:hypothetical protein
MEPLSYDDNPLMQEIRQSYGNDRRNLEGTPDASEFVQVKLRSGGAESGQSGREESRNADETARGISRDKESKRTAKTGPGRKRRSNSENDENNVSSDTGNRPTDDAIQRDKRKRISNADKEKPAGIEARPNSREKAARKESAAGEKAGILNAWGLGRNKGKDKAEKPKKEPLRSKPFSEAEAEAIKEPLLAALLDYFKYADEIIYATNKKHEQVEIWSGIDYEDAEFLVDVWLRRARTSVKAASHVTAVVNKHEELRVAAIALPRAYQTFMVYFQNGIGVR